MMQRARFFRGLLLLSGLILTLHTLVPHVHGAQQHSLPETAALTPAPVNANSWLSFLADLVDADMGEDHLENFSPEKSLDLELPISVVPATIPPALFAERYLYSTDTALLPEEQPSVPAPFLTEAHLRRIALRGPPIMA